MKISFLGHEAKFGGSMKFWANVLPSFSGLKHEPSKTPAEAGAKMNLL
jgi:hypothetical protein